MCQVVPYTLPCCRRAYVEVSQLPSCPEGWPEKKCPPELCIQVRYDPEDRNTGTCWRCQAEAVGISGEQRENLRPGIDRAMIVLGLDEVSPSDRRRQVEQGGNCWFCGAASGCKYCGSAVDLEALIMDEKTENHGKRKRQAHARKDHAANKKVKVEPRSTPQPQASRALTYPDPEQMSQWQNGFSNYNNLPANGFSQTSRSVPGLPLTQSFDTQAGAPGTVAVDWAFLQTNGHMGFGNGPGQSYPTQSQAAEPHGESTLNHQSFQDPQYLDPALIAPAAQSDASQTLTHQNQSEPQAAIGFQQCPYPQVLNPALDMEPTVRIPVDQTQTLVGEPEWDPSFNNTTYQYPQSPAADSVFKPALQPEFNLEDRSHLDDASLTQLLNLFTNYDSTLSQPAPLTELSPSGQSTNQEEGCGHKHAKAEQSSPSTEGIYHYPPGS